MLMRLIDEQYLRHPEFGYPRMTDWLRDQVDQVWSMDITYIPMQHGFMYLAAVIDWYSRYVLAWELSNTMESLFCVSALQHALT